MRTTRIDIEGPNGTATIERVGPSIQIDGSQLTKAIDTKKGGTCLVSRLFRLNADATDIDGNGRIAAELQHRLDGYIGTNGDVDSYRRAIAVFED